MILEPTKVLEAQGADQGTRFISDSGLPPRFRSRLEPSARRQSLLLIAQSRSARGDGLRTRLLRRPPARHKVQAVRPERR